MIERLDSSKCDDKIYIIYWALKKAIVIKYVGSIIKAKAVLHRPH